MSIASEITRLTNLRNTIRTKLVALGLASVSDDLDDCATAISGISAQAAQTITPTGTAQTIAAGKYLTGAQTVEAVVCDNLTAANIVSGVTVKVGTTTDDDSVASVTGTASGGGGGAVVGTFTPAGNTQSVTLSDTIGKSSIMIYPMFDIATADITDRIHWGGVISNGKCILAGSTNTGKSSWVFNYIFSNATGQITNADAFDPTTGTVTIVAQPSNNYGGYYISGKQYGYVAW